MRGLREVKRLALMFHTSFLHVNLERARGHGGGSRPHGGPREPGAGRPKKVTSAAHVLKHALVHFCPNG